MEATPSATPTLKRGLNRKQKQALLDARELSRRLEAEAAGDTEVNELKGLAGMLTALGEHQEATVVLKHAIGLCEKEPGGRSSQEVASLLLEIARCE